MWCGVLGREEGSGGSFTEEGLPAVWSHPDKTALPPSYICARLGQAEELHQAGTDIVKPLSTNSDPPASSGCKFETTRQCVFSSPSQTFGRILADNRFLCPSQTFGRILSDIVCAVAFAIRTPALFRLIMLGIIFFALLENRFFVGFFSREIMARRGTARRVFDLMEMKNRRKMKEIIGENEAFKYYLYASVDPESECLHERILNPLLNESLMSSLCVCVFRLSVRQSVCLCCFVSFRSAL